MQCGYFDAGVCRSCTLMGVPYERQLVEKDASVRERLAAHPSIVWEPPVASPESGFRAKAKMVVGGTVDAPTLGILDAEQRGVDLRECGVLAEELRAVLPTLADFISRARLEPYDIPARRGELKYLLLQLAPSGEIMLRFVMRSREAETRIRKYLPELLDRLPQIDVVSLNLQPEHKAVIEGEREFLFSENAELRMPLAGLDLFLRPGGFFQTNTAIAAALYEQARAWATPLDVTDAVDLYSGVGGFALAVAAPGRRVRGVEVSAPAVEAAQRSAAASALDVEFEVGDATQWLEQRPSPDLVIVNPPRRGLGERLRRRLADNPPAHVLYSSCNPVTLTQDLAEMASLRPVRGRLFDMFPQTGHSEVMVLLERR